MSDISYTLTSLTLAGFRAYLEPREFALNPKRCLAIFASNGKGKSGVVDALEFIFSENGTLARLGIRAIHNQAGPLALAHYSASDRNIQPKVTVKFRRGAETLEGTRNASGTSRDRPEAATTVSKHFNVNPLIRGYELRRFVEEQKAEDRYTEVANWLQLTPLAEVQKNLRLLRQQVKADAEDNSALTQINTQVSRETNNVVTTWDEPAVIAFANENILAPLDATLKLTTLAADDPAFLILAERANAEELQLGLAGLRQIRSAASSIYAENIDADDNTVSSGFLVEYESAVAARATAIEREALERNKAAASTFAALWQIAKPLFAEGAPEIEACPVCATPIAETTAGSTTGIRNHIATHLGELAEYAAAKAALDAAVTLASKTHDHLIAAIRALLPLLTKDYEALNTTLVAHLKTLEAWADDPSPNSAGTKSELVAVEAALTTLIDEIEARQGDHTYTKALARTKRLIEFKEQHDLAKKIQSELKTISTALNEQASFVSAQIRTKVQALLDKLRVPINDIYKAIQGSNAVPVRLELPPEDETNQQRLNLLINFVPNRQGVQPAGYLSDSQIHSLALALRIAAIKQFNAGAPIVAFDDIVTSYDADHRRTIAAMVAASLSDLQIVITTHDQRFFSYLKDQLPENNWSFLQITRLDPDFGPRFTDHRVTDAMIKARWDQGQPAANEIRQAEEEWLLALCRDFGVKVRIRSVEGAYSYERSELALALAAFLKGAGLVPPLVPGVQNKFLASLQQGTIENFGSHFQDAQYGNGSEGDERARWNEFVYFSDQFACGKCGRKRFKRAESYTKPVCSHSACEAQFEFPAAPAPKVA